VFGLDLFVQFFFAYEKSATEIEERLPYIAVNYLKGWFAIDFMACFPFEHIISFFIPAEEELMLA
jgi:hypothetical protein